MVRTPCCKEEGIKKGAWTPEEDQKLIAYLQLHGEGGWRTLPEKAGLKRCGKSCRLRWANYLRPDIKRGEFTPEEDDTIIKLHALKGNKWAAIATSLAGRTDNEIKNYWNTNLKKRLKQKARDSTTHKPINSTGQPGLELKTHKPVYASGPTRLLNRVASKYALDLNRDILTGIISGNTTIMAEDSQNSGEVDSSTSTLVNKMSANSVMIKPSHYTASTSSGFSDNCSFSDDLTELFNNKEISNMYSTVDNFELMEELKGILSYGGASDVGIEDSPEFLDFLNEEDNMDLEKFVSSLDSKVGVFF
ncbi:hypothetical protein AALP_AA3G303000 [Arabis alpina]|uniref:Uncharacterized protein n=1 Tax=Arabis alpina TaxID=50452 RepID=A0A087HCP5_ARAAL|nr:hypothetical protein AALP_AA3G303000 [Arabis alpina]